MRTEKEYDDDPRWEVEARDWEKRLRKREARKEARIMKREHGIAQVNTKKGEKVQ